MYKPFRHTGTTKLLWRKLGTAMHRGSSAPGVRAALVCAGPVLVGLAQVQLARQQEYAADRTAVRQPVHYDLSTIRRQLLSILSLCTYYICAMLYCLVRLSTRNGTLQAELSIQHALVRVSTQASSRVDSNAFLSDHS